jgi:hypothetical protein
VRSQCSGAVLAPTPPAVHCLIQRDAADLVHDMHGLHTQHVTCSDITLLHIISKLPVVLGLRKLVKPLCRCMPGKVSHPIVA